MLRNKFLPLLIAAFFLFHACANDAGLPTETTTANPTESQGDCLEFSGFPDIPGGWQSEETTIPDSYNRSWKPYFLDGEKGFLYGSDGLLLRTTNGGGNWQESGNWSELSFGQMFFLDGEKGFLSALDRNAGGPNLIGGALLKTTDGGATWVKNDYSPVGTLSSIYFLNEQDGFALFRKITINSAVESISYLTRTEDGGHSWSKVGTAVPANSIHNSLEIFDSGFGYFGGDEGKVFLTHDSGETWQAVETGLNGLYRVQFLDEMNGFVGAYKTMLRTTDGGTNWTEVSQLNTSFFHFFSPTEGISLQTESIYDHGDYWDECNAFLLTHDGGGTWLSGGASFNFRLGDVFFLNENLGFSSRDFHPGSFVRLEK